jgi:hypothetical protein
MQSKLVMLTYADDAPLFPSQGLPGAPVYPSQGLPVYPTTGPVPGLPPGAVQLPVFPWDPTVTPPIATPPPVAGQPLPTPPGTVTPPIATPPPIAANPIAPGGRFIVKYLACVGLILVPDNSLPTNPAQPK